LKGGTDSVRDVSGVHVFAREGSRFEVGCLREGKEDVVIVIVIVVVVV
jgi:hypothetical protein